MSLLVPGETYTSGLARRICPRYSGAFLCSLPGLVILHVIDRSKRPDSFCKRGDTLALETAERDSSDFELEKTISLGVK